jgi:voltage-gated potassium channel
MKVNNAKYETLKRKIHVVIYGTNTFAGRLFDFILLGLILLSVLIVMIETVKGFDAKYHNQLVIIEWVITIFFAIEYLMRIWVIKQPKKYIFSFYGIIDFIAMLPMFLSLFFAGTSIIAVVRALRLLRLFKILNHPQFSTHSNHLRESLIKSRGKIIIFIYFILIITVLVGSLMYVIEGDEAGFTSIPVSIYWCIVTLTTVGFGDITPITPLGQFLASVLMIMGYGIIAVPTGIVTAEFAFHKNNLKNNGIMTCRHCGNEILRETAKFCDDCGNEIEQDKIKPS